MYRSSLKARPLRRVAVFGFFALSLLLAISSKPWATAQAVWRVELKEGETASSSLSINNHCAAAHSFRVTSKLKSLRFNESTDSVLIEASGSKRIAASFDARGLKSRVYGGKVDIECLDCKKEQGCSQDRDELALEMNVIKSVMPAGVEKGNSAAQSQSNPQLTLNKIHVTNANDPITGPPAPTTWQPGVPITYVISLSNSGAANSNISVADPLPPGFVFVSATCAASSGAACTTSTPGPPPFGPFNIPTGGNVEIRMTGYFTTGGPKLNTATATAGVLPVGNANSSTDQLTVSSGQSPVNVAVAKAVSVTSATFPAHLHYTITVTNTTATSVYLGGNIRLRDVFSLSPSLAVNWTVSNPTCTAFGGALCPDMPTSVPNNAGTIYFEYDAAGASTANDNGWLPGNGSYKIEFDVDLTKAATCGPAQVSWGNQAILDSLNGFTDSNPNDNSSQQVLTTITTGLTPCAATAPTVTKIKCLTPSGACAPSSTAAWNTPVRYRITVNNPTTGTLTGIPLADSIYKTTGTPTLTGTVTVNPQCVSGCSALNSLTIASPAPTLSADYVLGSLWSATLPTLAASQQAVIEYTVVYAPECETDAQDDYVVNRITAGPAWSDSAIKMTPEATSCNLTVDKQKLTPGPIVFEQPTTYKVVYSNLSAASLAITVRDALSVTSSQYGNFTFNYSTSCTATAGTISPLPVPKNNVLSTVTYKQFGWQGLRLIDEHPTFGPSSILTCQVAVTAHKPPDNSPFCQGSGNPQLDNAAFIGSSTNYDPIAKPTLYDSEAADLPLCRSVIVSKVSPTHNYGPGATITYTITVENKGQNAVGSFLLKDIVPPPLTAVSVSGCTPSSACIAGPTLSAGTVNVSYGLLQPNTPVLFTLTVTAPQAGGSYPNVAVGSFPIGGNFYFQGDETQFLQQEENIQVLTPTLSKLFDPAQIAPNGNSTLTFNVTNTNTDPKQTGIAFADTLPPGLQIVGIISNGCGGNVTTSTDGHTVILNGGQLVGPNADGSGKHSCQISVKVKASSECGVYENKKANFSQVANLDVSAIDADLDVVGCSASGTPTLEKVYEPTKIPLNGTTTLNFTITNSSGDPKQTGIAFSDTLPPGLQIVGVVSNGCSGTVIISPDHQTLTLTGGQLNLGQHTCKIAVRVRASDHCGVYPNTEKNFSDVKNLDVSGIDEQLAVGDCQSSGGLIVEKVVKGAPKGFKGQFNFLVQCATPKGFYQKAVTVDWPTPGFTTLTDVPVGNQCLITEGPPPSSLPTSYSWAGLPAYSPKGGVVNLDPKGGHVTVTDTMSPCNETGQVTINKVVEGLPKDYIGVFEGTLQCWVSDKLVTYPVTLTSPNGLSTTINNIPLGNTCTFQETGQPPLQGDLKWNQPIYSPRFGTVTLTGECCQQITVTNQARHCCSQAAGPGSGAGQNYPDAGPVQSLNYAAPTKGTPTGRKDTRKANP